MRLSLKEVPVLLLCGLLFCSSSCNKDEDIPACIKKEIDASVPNRRDRIGSGGAL